LSKKYNITFISFAVRSVNFTVITDEAGMKCCLINLIQRIKHVTLSHLIWLIQELIIAIW